MYFVVATLEYLRRGGRIGRASALLGSVLQVKPVLTLQEGQVAPLERDRPLYIDIDKSRLLVGSGALVDASVVLS